MCNWPNQRALLDCLFILWCCPIEKISTKLTHARLINRLLLERSIAVIEHTFLVGFHHHLLHRFWPVAIHPCAITVHRMFLSMVAVYYIAGNEWSKMANLSNRYFVAFNCNCCPNSGNRTLISDMMTGEQKTAQNEMHFLCSDQTFQLSHLWPISNCQLQTRIGKAIKAWCLLLIRMCVLLHKLACPRLSQLQFQFVLVCHFKLAIQMHHIDPIFHSIAGLKATHLNVIQKSSVSINNFVLFLFLVVPTVLYCSYSQ